MTGWGELPRPQDKCSDPNCGCKRPTAPAEPDAPADTLDTVIDDLNDTQAMRCCDCPSCNHYAPDYILHRDEPCQTWALIERYAAARADAVLAEVRGQAAAVEARARLQGEAVGLREAARRIEVAHPITADRFRTLADKRDRAAAAGREEGEG